MQATLFDAVTNRRTYQTAGSWMCRMCFDDDRISGRQGGCRISSANGKSQRKVAGAKYSDGAERAQHGAKIRPGAGLAIGFGAVDSRPHPRSFFCHLRKKPKLSTSARRLALQTGFGQRSLLVRAINQFFANGFNLCCNRAKKSSSHSTRSAPVNAERLRCTPYSQ